MHFEVELDVTELDSLVAVDFLWSHFDQLSKSRIKDAMKKGAVFLERKGERSSLRKAQTPLKIGDKVEVYYDQDYLNMKPQKAELLTDQIQYSIWLKPAGMPLEGELFGDHLSLLRVADQSYDSERDAYLLYELADDSKGVLLIVHHRRSAATFTAMLENNEIRFKYRVEVSGQFEDSTELDFDDEDFTLKGKLEPVRYVEHTHSTVVDLYLNQGESKDICSYFMERGYPVLGDEYIGGNTDRDVMQLGLVELDFTCPISGDLMHYRAY
ncbi:pseudouridine synthase [Litoribacillus peritrichatus]|uniref:Pseudouridine synthase RsuA/RluA-like domain-containing protein n=1 Tax=Litoribacillus peritrichatus TaxID=718191 RepID=A0ABP7MYV3_9GAMM